MISRWYGYKAQAVSLRQKGESIREIEKKLKIPRSTLSGWFKNIKLSEAQRRALNKKRETAFAEGRAKAVLWHNKQKEDRLIEAKLQADLTLSNIDIKDKQILELALAMLYLGEGSKKKCTSLGNTNPLILKFFIKSLSTLYNLDKSTFRCELHLRSDQNQDELIKFWSNELEIPIINFYFVKDKRPIKSKTYPYYKGVCVVVVGRIDILRRLSFLNEGFCGKILEHKVG